MPLPTLPKRFCECPKHELYTPKRSDQKYAFPECKGRAYRARHALRWDTRLTAIDRRCLTAMIDSIDPMIRRGGYQVDAVGEEFGLSEGMTLMCRLVYVIGIVFIENADGVIIAESDPQWTFQLFRFVPGKNTFIDRDAIDQVADYETGF